MYNTIISNRHKHRKITFNFSILLVNFDSVKKIDEKKNKNKQTKLNRFISSAKKEQIQHTPNFHLDATNFLKIGEIQKFFCCAFSHVNGTGKQCCFDMYRKVPTRVDLKVRGCYPPTIPAFKRLL